MKIAVVYWSGTGNTETLANAVAEGAKKAGGDVSVFSVGEFSADKMKDYDGFLFGCPAMGAEELEDAEFEPFFAEAEKNLKDVPVGLFGSYDWGDGEWMRNWQERTKNAGARLVSDGLHVQQANTDASAPDCEALGEKLAKALA